MVSIIVIEQVFHRKLSRRSCFWFCADLTRVLNTNWGMFHSSPDNKEEAIELLNVM